MRRGGFGFWSVLAAAVAAAVPSLAAEPVRTTDWTLTLGVEGRVLPSYEGSDRYVLRPVPLIDLRRAGTARKFSGARDGVSIGVVDNGTFRFGFSGKVRLPRRESDDSALRGLGDVDWTFEGGAFAEFWAVNWFRTRLDVRQGFGGHTGVVADLTGDVVVPVTPQLTLSAGPRVTFVTAKANDPYYGITAAQSAATGLPVFSAGSGMQSFGVGGLARYEFSRQWATHFFVEYQQIAGSAKDSPLVALRGNPNQMQIGIGVNYSFDVPGLW